MKIPEKIEIGCFTFYIKNDQKLLKNVRGEADVQNQKIYIDTDLTEEQKIETFWHEIIEVINNEYNLEMNHYTILILGMGITQVIKSMNLSGFE